MPAILSSLLVSDARIDYDCPRHTFPGVPMATPQNPYAAPASRVEDELPATVFELIPNGRAVPASHGWRWVVAAWDLFKRSPGVWILITLIGFGILIASVFVRLFGLVLQLLTPVLGGGVMLGCAALERGEPLQVEHLFAGFRVQTGPLVKTGLLYIAGTAVIMLVVALTVGIPLMMMMKSANTAVLTFQMLILPALLGFGLSLPLVMALWFAPALVVLNHMKPLDALKTSFTGCLKNILPFLVYSLVMLGLATLATLPAFLGLLVLWPVVMASVYTSYRDIFTQPTP
jgi:hypothetical protein